MTNHPQPLDGKSLSMGERFIGAMMSAIQNAEIGETPEAIKDRWDRAALAFVTSLSEGEKVLGTSSSEHAAAPQAANPADAAATGRLLVPREPDGQMWSAGRRAFAAKALAFENAKTTAARIVAEDTAPDDIYRAMLTAAPTPTEISADVRSVSDDQEKHLDANSTSLSGREGLIERAQKAVSSSWPEHTLPPLISELATALARAEGEVAKWREEALRQYPTPEAYDAVCAARTEWQARAETLEAQLATVRGENTILRMRMESRDQAFIPMAKALTAAESRLAEVVGALEPFAKIGRELWNPTRDDDPVWLTDVCGTLKDEFTNLTVADFRRADEALRSTLPSLSGRRP